MQIPFLSFDELNSQIEEEIFNAFRKFYDSKQYVLGGKLETFEAEFASFSNTKHSLGVGNGLDALHLALLSLGIGSGDEVILPSNTFIATVMAVTYTGAKPVFVEPNIQTYNISPLNVESAVTSKTKVIMPVHLYGQACQMDELTLIANKLGLCIVEDNAQAQGATCQKKKTGSFGEINATSFYPGKNLGAFGDGGAITTNNSELAEKVKVLRNYGSEKKYHNSVIGYNSRLDELQASFLSVKLKSLDKWSRERVQIANWYNKYLDPQKVVKPKIADGCTSVYHLYVIRHKNRDLLQSFLKEKGIATLIHYPIPPHLQEAYKNLGYSKGDFPIAEKLSNEVISLPVFIGMKEEQVIYICQQINEF